MRQWEVYFIDDLPHGPHPVVVISASWLCARDSIKFVNVLMCSSVRGADGLGEYETGLDQAEGLEQLSGCQAHSFLALAKRRFEGKQPLGIVSLSRREDIKRKVKNAFALH